MRIRSVAARRGQNTAEYLILLVLVAVGAITIFGAFGDTIKSQVGTAILALEGKKDDSTGVSGAVPGILQNKSTMGVKGRDLSVYAGQPEEPGEDQPEGEQDGNGE